MNTKSFTVRPMTRQELDTGIEWAAAEGWNPGLYDADSFYAADTTGFWLGLLQDEPVGMVSAVKYGRDFGFIGFYMVRPEYRGHGYGLALWNTAVRALQGRLVGLDGVVAQQHNYRKSGFSLTYNNVRYQGHSKAAAPHDPSIVPVAALAFADLQAYDAAFFPGDRSAFLRSWATQQGSTALALVQHGQCVGYGVIRPCRSGFKLGPLFADSADIADRLLRALMASIPASSLVQLDVPHVHSAAVALAQSHGMQPVFETARMYTGPAPALPLERVFGVTSFELG